MNFLPQGKVDVPPQAPQKQALTAVCAVMWVQPTILAPAKGFSPWARFLSEIRADMSAKGRELLMLVQYTGCPLHHNSSLCIPRISPAQNFCCSYYRQRENSSALAWHLCAKHDPNTSVICHLTKGQGERQEGVWDWQCLGKALGTVTSPVAAGEAPKLENRTATSHKSCSKCAWIIFPF